VVVSLLAEEVQAAVDLSLSYEQGVILEREWAARDGGRVLFSPTQLREAEIQFRPELVNPTELLDLRVRQALLSAVDRRALNDALLGGRGLVVDSPISSTMPYYPTIEPRIRKYPYDTRLAEQLLTEAGLQKGADGFFNRPNGERFSPEVWAITGGTNDAELQITVDGFHRIGVDATSRVQPTSWLGEARARTQFPGLSMSGVGGESGIVQLRSEPPAPANQFLGGGGRGGWSSAEFDRVVDAFSIALDRTERVRLVGEMARIYSEQLPKLPFYYTVRVTAHSSAIKGPVLGTTPNAGAESWNIHLWEWQS
jgi:peptide/nickel transport system substrate-binding protein